MALEDLKTSVKCDGSGEALDLLKSHLVVTVKVQKNVLQVPTPSGRTDEATVEDDEETEITLGTRSGVGEVLHFKDYEAAAAYFQKLKSRKLRLKLNTDDTDPYAEGAEIMHGSDEEEGDEE